MKISRMRYQRSQIQSSYAICQLIWNLKRPVFQNLLNIEISIAYTNTQHKYIVIFLVNDNVFVLCISVGNWYFYVVFIYFLKHNMYLRKRGSSWYYLCLTVLTFDEIMANETICCVIHQIKIQPRNFCDHICFFINNKMTLEALK